MNRTGNERVEREKRKMMITTNEKRVGGAEEAEETEDVEEEEKEGKEEKEEEA